MPLVNLVLNGRSYTLSCDEGEQEHLKELGNFLERRVRDLAATVGQVGDARLMLMAGLMVADELNEALAKVDERESEIAALKGGEVINLDEVRGLAENRVAEVLEAAAMRIEAIATRVGRA